MEKVKFLFKSRRISRIIETEKGRYVSFFSISWKENLAHSKDCIKKYPRWSIISGYYAMHDIAKLFLADKFSIKVDKNVHESVIIVLKALVKDKKISEMLNLGYSELIKMMDDLSIARRKRTKAQYYTGTEFMKEKYKIEAKDFIFQIVVPFIEKIKGVQNDY